MVLSYLPTGGEAPWARPSEGCPSPVYSQVIHHAAALEQQDHHASTIGDGRKKPVSFPVRRSIHPSSPSRPNSLAEQYQPAAIGKVPGAVADSQAAGRCLARGAGSRRMMMSRPQAVQTYPRNEGSRITTTSFSRGIDDSQQSQLHSLIASRSMTYRFF